MMTRKTATLPNLISAGVSASAGVLGVEDRHAVDRVAL